MTTKTTRTQTGPMIERPVDLMNLFRKGYTLVAKTETKRGLLVIKGWAMVSESDEYPVHSMVVTEMQQTRRIEAVRKTASEIVYGLTYIGECWIG